jgi:hypothetical protein
MSHVTGTQLLKASEYVKTVSVPPVVQIMVDDEPKKTPPDTDWAVSISGSDAPDARQRVYENKSVAGQNMPPEQEVNVDNENPPKEHVPLLHSPVVNVGQSFSDDEKKRPGPHGFEHLENAP